MTEELNDVSLVVLNGFVVQAMDSTAAEVNSALLDIDTFVSMGDLKS